MGEDLDTLVMPPVDKRGHLFNLYRDIRTYIYKFKKEEEVEEEEEGDKDRMGQTRMGDIRSAGWLIVGHLAGVYALTPPTWVCQPAVPSTYWMA